MNELNGFKIDKYNQYDLDLTQKTSICPLCSSSRKINPRQKCLQIFTDTGLAYCNHCGERIQLHTYKKKSENKDYVKPKTYNNTELPDNVLEWWRKRCISQFTLRQMKIGYSVEWMPGANKKINVLMFPYYKEGELINIKYRGSYKENGNFKRAFKLEKDAQKIPYNIDAIMRDKECIIVEGEPDVLTYIECGIRNVVSSPNGSTNKGNVNLTWLDENIEAFENKETIYLGLDQDEAGQHVQKELIRRLGAHKVKIITYNGCKDANELLCKEGKEAVIDTIKNATELPLEGVSTYKDVVSDLEKFYTNGWDEGYKIGLKCFDEIFSTYTGQYIVLTGIPGSGKSDFADQMVLGYAIKYGWHIAYASPENKPNYLHINKLMTKLVGYRPELKNIKDAGYKACAKFINDKISLIDSDRYDLENVLNKAAELVKRKGLKCLVIDPYNKVKLNGADKKNINDKTGDYLYLIDEFCRKYDVLVILVMHPNKMNSIDGKITEPTMYDVKGGGEVYDMTYHGILIHRDKLNKFVKAKVLKLKFEHLGEDDAEVYLRWNPFNTRYMELDGDNLTPLPDRKGIPDYTNWVTNNIEEESNAKAYEDVVSGFSKDVFDELSQVSSKGEEYPF